MSLARRFDGPVSCFAKRQVQLSGAPARAIVGWLSSTVASGGELASAAKLGLPARQMIGRGQIDVEDRATAGRIVKTDLSMHAHDDLPHNAQTKAGAFFFMSHRSIRLRKLFKNSRLDFRWEADAVVAQRYANMIAMLLDRNDDFFPRR